jgi:hypothetical protein
MGILVYHRLRQLIARITFFVATIKIRLKTFLDYRITKRFDQYNVLRNSGSLSNDGIAIVAIYPRSGIQDSVMRLIDSLTDSNYSVIVVMNESHLAEDWLVSLLKKPVEILRRPNIGRDFGAYKIGFIHAEKNGYLQGTERLLFANDSVAYGPQSIAFVKSMLKIERTWHAMFVNHQFHTHAQSFFQVFRKEVFTHPDFSAFWAQYYPSELRHHAINFGEVHLSSVCLKNGFTPEPYITAQSILSDPAFDTFRPDEKFGIWSNHGLIYFDEKIANFENTKFMMKRQYLENNITHHQGLLASRVLKAPIKLDIVQSGQVTNEGLLDTLSDMGFSGDEASEIFNAMTNKGTHASNRGLRRIWKSYGYC